MLFALCNAETLMEFRLRKGVIIFVSDVCQCIRELRL